MLNSYFYILVKLNTKQQVFLFVNEFTVDKYKQDLTEEIEPQIIELIERAKKGMKALERKKLSLQNKVHNRMVNLTYLMMFLLRLIAPPPLMQLLIEVQRQDLKQDVCNSQQNKGKA